MCFTIKPHKLTLLVFAACAVLSIQGCKAKPSSDPSWNKHQAAPSSINRNTPKALALNALAVKEIKKNNLAEAEKLLIKAIQNDQMTAQAHNNLGKVYYLQNNFYKAAWEYQYAVKLNPKAAAPHHNLALTFQSAGQLDKALPHYTKAHDLEPESAIYLSSLAQAHLNLGHKDQKVIVLLQELILRSVDEDQKIWARRELHLMREKIK